MNTIEKITAANRTIAGQLLAKRLDPHADSDAVVLGISRGGVVVAASVAEALDLPLNVLVCRKLVHPGNREKSIGAVTLKDVVLSNNCYDIPRDYIGHQIALIRSSLRSEFAQYNGGYNAVSIEQKTVILVDDLSQSGVTLLSSVKSLKKQKPSKIVVAVPFISAKAAFLIGELADEVVFLRMDRTIKSANDYYDSFREVLISDVKNILTKHQTRSKLLFRLRSLMIMAMIVLLSL